MYTQEEINLITLCGIEELTYNARYKLLCGLSSPYPDFAKCANLLIKTLSAGVYNKVKDKFYDSAFRERLLRTLDKKGVKCVTFFSPEYPESLKNTSAPPVVLFWKGDTRLLGGRLFAVVGSRRTLPKVIAECKKISGELTKKFTVVSGLAEGADSAALQGALDAGGRVVSVLAYGFDYVYPAFNSALVKRVEGCGLLVSEYLPSTAPKNFQFPVRNRIIAGLAEGALIVSAGRKSGALITAGYCFDYGRDVFAFPYNAGTLSGEGCNSLIKKGAYLTENILDISNVYGLDFKTSETKPLTADEKALFDAVREEGEAFIPAIADKLGKQPFQLIPLLTSLEIKGLIVRLGGNRYSAV